MMSAMCFGDSLQQELITEMRDIQRVSVLVVDDHQQALSVLKRVLDECHYDSICLTDPLEAMAVLKTTKYDVLMCDVIMPELSGLELMKQALEVNPEIVCILMSAYADVSTARQAVDIGASDFLVKPFSLLSIPISIERNLRLRQIEKNRIIEQRNKVLLGSIKALSAAMDAKESHTAEHSYRIVSIAMLIADEMGLSNAEKTTLELASYMHDIGKIGVKESILLKPEALSEEEWQEIRMHPDTGSRILSNIEELSDLAEIIRHHHERVDGKGYPDGMKGDQIPLLSRILAVADAFDAMTSDRPYRPRLTSQEALNQLISSSGTQFDKEIVDIFIRVWKDDLSELNDPGS